MNSRDTLSNDGTLIAVMAVIIGFFLIFALVINLYLPFKNKRDYIKMEMSRSDDNEYYYWKRKLKKLYLSYIPIIGRFFK